MNRSLLYFFTLFIGTGFAQIGGTTGFNFLNLPFNARVGGLGADFITARDFDPNLGIQNPALLNEGMDRRGSLNQGLFAGGVNTGGLNYARHFTSGITGLAHFRYVAYGTMRRTDINGADLGTFSPGDFILGASASKSINERMHVGATFNIIYSQLDDYIAFGNSLDIGGCYTDEEKRVVISGVIKHLGIQWKSYNQERSPLPLEVQLGLSHKLAHAPFRFSVLAQHLEKWDLTYNDPSAKDRTDPLTGNVIPAERAGFGEKLARHFVFQTEILFGKKLHLRAGFDYHRRQELKVVQRPGIAGFSFGAGLYFRRFSIDYGIMSYSAAGAQNMLSLTLPLGAKN